MPERMQLQPAVRQAENPIRVENPGDAADTQADESCPEHFSAHLGSDPFSRQQLGGQNDGQNTDKDWAAKRRPDG